MRFLVKIAPHSFPNGNHFRIGGDRAHPYCFAHNPQRVQSVAFCKTLLRFGRRSKKTTNGCSFISRHDILIRVRKADRTPQESGHSSHRLCTTPKSRTLACPLHQPCGQWSGATQESFCTLPVHSSQNHCPMCSPATSRVVRPYKNPCLPTRKWPHVCTLMLSNRTGSRPLSFAFDMRHSLSL